MTTTRTTPTPYLSKTHLVFLVLAATLPLVAFGCLLVGEDGQINWSAVESELGLLRSDLADLAYSTEDEDLRATLLQVEEVVAVVEHAVITRDGDTDPDIVHAATAALRIVENMDLAIPDEYKMLIVGATMVLRRIQTYANAQ